MPSIEVPAIRVDEYIPQSSEVTFVKIDIQGSEVDALQGMRRILSGSNRLVVICECSPHALHQAGSDVDTLMDTLQSAGLTVKVLDRKGLCDASSILRDRRRWNDPYYYRNLIAYHPSQQILMEEICGMVR